MRLPFGMMFIVPVAEAPCATTDGKGAISICGSGITTSKASGADAVRFPDVPVIVKVEAYVSLVVLTESSLDSVVGFWLHAALRPGGKGDVIVRFTAPVNPPYRMMDAFVVAVAPCGTMKVDEGNNMLNPGASTFNVNETLDWLAPLVPVTVTAYDPRTAELATDNVSTLISVTGLMLKKGVTPLGKPKTARFTLPVKPFCATTDMVDVP